MTEASILVITLAASLAMLVVGFRRPRALRKRWIASGLVGLMVSTWIAWAEPIGRVLSETTVLGSVSVVTMLLGLKLFVRGIGPLRPQRGFEVIAGDARPTQAMPTGRMRTMCRQRMIVGGVLLLISTWLAPATWVNAVSPRAAQWREAYRVPLKPAAWVLEQSRSGVVALSVSANQEMGSRMRDPQRRLDVARAAIHRAIYESTVQGLRSYDFWVLEEADVLAELSDRDFELVVRAIEHLEFRLPDPVVRSEPLRFNMHTWLLSDQRPPGSTRFRIEPISLSLTGIARNLPLSRHPLLPFQYSADVDSLWPSIPDGDLTLDLELRFEADLTLDDGSVRSRSVADSKTLTARVTSNPQPSPSSSVAINAVEPSQWQSSVVRAQDGSALTITVWPRERVLRHFSGWFVVESSDGATLSTSITRNDWLPNQRFTVVVPLSAVGEEPFELIYVPDLVRLSRSNAPTFDTEIRISVNPRDDP